MDCTCEPKFPLSEEGLTLSRLLKIFALVFIIISIVRMIVLLDFSSLINDIMVSFVIFFSALCANFILASLTVILLLFNILNTLLFVGLRIQNKSMNLRDPYGRESKFIFILVFSSVSIIFSIICIVYCFKAYKEFKYLETEYMKSGAYSKLFVNYRTCTSK